MGPGDADFWINNRRILRLAHRLSKQTGESVDQAVLVALQERLEREHKVDPAIRPFVRPELVAAARLVASSIRSRRVRSEIEELLAHPVTAETLDEILESRELESWIAELGLLPEDDEELIEFCARLEGWARENSVSTCLLFLALVQKYVQSANIHIRRTTERSLPAPYASSQRKVLIPFQSENIPKGFPCSSREDTLRVTWDDILWAALTVGRPSLSHVFKHGRRSVYEALFRLSLVRMAVEQGVADQRLHRTKAFEALDPTEKGAVSYFLGMVICKIFADKCLSTPWVLHVDVFGDPWNVQVDPGRSRPDLFGQRADATAWHVFESKGRSGYISHLDKSKAKGQVLGISSIDGVQPTLYVGALSYFRQSGLHFYWCDPDPSGRDEDSEIKLELPSDAWSEHYRLVAEIMRSAGALAPFRDDDGPLGAPRAVIAALDVAVGAHPTVRRHLFERRYNAARAAASDLPPDFAGDKTESEPMYRPDGLIVRSGSSWSEPRN